MPKKNNSPGGDDRAYEGVLKDVKTIVGEQMGIAPEEIEEGHSLFDDLACDSLDIVEISMELEDHFDVSVPDDLADRVRTVRQMTDGVLELLGQPQAN